MDRRARNKSSIGATSSGGGDGREARDLITEAIDFIANLPKLVVTSPVAWAQTLVSQALAVTLLLPAEVAVAKRPSTAGAGEYLRKSVGP